PLHVALPICSRFNSTDAPPVEACKQRLELGMAQRHQAVPDAGPGEAVFLQTLIGHHHAAAIPVDQLQPVRPARPEDKDRSCERVLAQLVLHQRRQPVMAFAEVYRLRRHHDPHAVRRKDHAEANAHATTTIRAADAPSSRRIMTGPTMISGRLDAFLIGGWIAGVSSTSDANSTAPSGSGKTCLTCRAIVRHDVRWFGFSTYRSATSFTVAPGRRLSETILALT